MVHGRNLYLMINDGLKIHMCFFRIPKLFLSFFTVIFRKLIVRVIDITFEGAEPPRRLYQLRVHQFSKCFVSWPNQKLEYPPTTVTFQKFIALSGIVLISFYYQE